MSFIPSDSDCTWMQTLINVMRDGGVWGTSFGIFQIDKQARRFTVLLTLEGTSVDAPDESVISRVRATCAKIGYTVVTPANN